MKFIFNLILATCFAATIMNAQKIDVNVKPEPMPAREVQFPQYVQKTLSNGLKVIIIEDKEQPTISMSLMIFGGSSVDSKTGTASLMSSMLTKGAGKRSASDIANSIDGIGASVGANAGGDNITIAASGLKKHMDAILDVFADVVTKPTFPKSEFDKLVQLTISNIQAEKSEAGKMAGAMSRMCVYGVDHPYAKKMTETGVTNININDLKEYYTKYFVPNNASIAIIGDIRADEAIKALEGAFKNWKKGTAPTIKLANPTPMPLGIYFINRPGSTQSSVYVTTPAIPYNHEDYESLDMAAKIIGSGFGGRLFRTLREKYSFTYTPFGALTSSKYANRFVCGADVNKEKTDSSISVIFEQLNLLCKEAPGESELGRQKKFEVGQYNLSFENSNFIAGLVQQSDFMGISIEKVKGYPQRVLETPASLVSAMANKYMNPKNAYIVVVSDKKVIPSLEKFGKVYEYTMDLEPKKLDKADISVEQLIEKYTNAIGKEAVAKTQSIATKGKASLTMNGKKMDGTLDLYQKSGNKYRMSMNLQNYKQDTYINGDKGVMEAGGQTFPVDPKNMTSLLVDAQLFPVINLKTLGNKLEVLGKQDGKIQMKSVDKNGDESIYYFDETTGYLVQIDNIEYNEELPTPVTTTFKDYKNFNGANLPTKKINVSPQYTIEVENTYELNSQLDDALFSPAK